MKIDSETVQELLYEISKRTHDDEGNSWKFIFPLVDKIAELEEEKEEREKEKNSAIDEFKTNNEQLKDKLSNVRIIFKSMNRDIPICDLYEKIKEIGCLLDVDSNEHIKTIEGMEGRFQKMKKMKFDLEEKMKLLQIENEELKKKISKLEDTNRKLSGELLNQTEEINMLEEEIERLKVANEDLKLLNRQIQENVK